MNRKCLIHKSAFETEKNHRNLTYEEIHKYDFILPVSLTLPNIVENTLF